MYLDMAEILNEGQIGDYALKKYTIERGNFAVAMQRISYGTYISLTHHGSIVMSNTDMEKRTNDFFVCRAHGDVLIGGLGIGMIILPIQDNPKVNSITVIEKSQEVIDLVSPQLPLNNKVKITHDDVFTYKPDRKYDCIYMDIWNYINSDIYKNSMTPLKRKYGHYLKPISESPRRFNLCWAEYEAKNNRRLY